VKQATVYDIGEIRNNHHDQQVKMWRASVPAGIRPLVPHQHIRFELMLVNAGSGIYTTTHGDYPIYPGDMFVFSSNEFHCITDVGSVGLDITNLHFEPMFLRKYGNDSVSFTDIRFCFSHSQSFSNRIPAEKNSQLALLMQAIRRELSDRDHEYTIAVKSLLHLMIISLLREHGYADCETEAKHEQVQNIQHVLSYIDKHLNEKIALRDLSDLAGLTPNYFCTLFKQICGFTPFDYINSRRIDKACSMLLHDGVKLNIISIANECGFNNTANFNKLFKKVMGLTPSEYRSNGNSLIS